MRLGKLLRRKNRLTAIGAVCIATIALIAVFANVIMPDPGSALGDTNPGDKGLAPSLKHLFGTDVYGRDILSRVIYGARISLVAGLTTMAIVFAVGITLGAVAINTGSHIRVALN